MDRKFTISLLHHFSPLFKVVFKLQCIVFSVEIWHLSQLYLACIVAPNSVSNALPKYPKIVVKISNEKEFNENKKDATKIMNKEATNETMVPSADTAPDVPFSTLFHVRM